MKYLVPLGYGALIGWIAFDSLVLAGCLVAMWLAFEYVRVAVEA